MWSAQQRGFAQIITLNPAPSPDAEFLIHAAPDTIQAIALRHNLTVIRTLDVPPYDVFLVRAAGVTTSGTGTVDDVAAMQKVTEIQSDPAVGRVELNALATAPEVPADVHLDQSPVWILDALTTRSLASFGGAQVWNSYLDQPSAAAIHLADSRAVATGAGVTVAVIDTGVDQHHPILQGVLVDGYDFVADLAGPGSEWTGVDSSITAVLDQSPVWILDTAVAPVKLNPSTLALLDPPRAQSLSTIPLPAAFGHGTMVAGVIHLVAPSARIMPLKAFTASGTSRVFDIVRAIYYAVDHGARVINMSFSTATWSTEITHAINAATDRGVICVASAGNLGQEILVFPGAHRNVIGIGSVSSALVPVRSVFSNYGDSLVSLAAPGEGVITTYPGGTYAGAWGTSFSAPMVAGAAALMLQIDPSIDHNSAAAALGMGDPMVRSGVGKGRLNLREALRRVTDSTPPSVSFSSPATGVVTHIVPVGAVATDNIGVAGVSFLVDDQLIAGEVTSPPYQIAWNTVGVPNGAHVLTAVARDAAGNKSTATLTVTISNDLLPPTVAIASPGAGLVSAAATISAAASDDVGVVGVQFQLDGAPLGQEATAAPYQLAWNTVTAPNGVHVLTAVARDAAGHTSTATPVQVTVLNDLAPPTIALTTAAGTASGTLTVAATASDDVGVVGVQFFLDGLPLGLEVTTPAYGVAWNTTTALNGIHVLTATARDAAGRTTTAAAVTITVAN